MLPERVNARDDGSSNGSAAGDAAERCFNLDEPFATLAPERWTAITASGGVSDVAAVLPDGAVPTSIPRALYARGWIPDAGTRSFRASQTTQIPLLPRSLAVRYALQVPTSAA